MGSAGSWIDLHFIDGCGHFRRLKCVRRRVWADAIDRLADAGARLTVLDLIFSEASDPEADAALAAAIKRHPGKVVLPAAFSPGGANPVGNDTYLWKEPDARFIFGEPETRLGYVNFYQDPVNGLIRSARYTTTLFFEDEGKRRTGEQERPSLAVEVIDAMGGTAPNGNQWLCSREAVKRVQRRIITLRIVLMKFSLTNMGK